MNNIQYIAGILFCLVVAIIQPEARFSHSPVNWGYTIAQLLAIMMLIQNGTLMGTIYWKIMLAGFLVGLGIAVFLMVQKYEFAALFSIATTLIIVGTYTIWFFKKTSKKRLDVLKLSYVYVSFIGVVLATQHLIPKEYSTIAAEVILWVAVLDFVVTGGRNKTLFERTT